MKNQTFAVIAVMALTIAGCARLQEKPSGFGSVADFRGLSLVTAPHESDPARLSDLFHAVPAGSGSYEMRPEVRTVYTGLDGTVYQIPLKGIFFVQHDPAGSNTLTYYGPFKGDPQALMKLPKQNKE
jgi:hypothetical protein